MRTLSTEELLRLHEAQHERHGGDPGVTDSGLLEGVVTQALARRGGEPIATDPFELAAAYLFHLAQYRPFASGNERTALLAALVTLDLHGIRIRRDDRLLSQLVDEAARGASRRVHVAARLRVMVTSA